MLKKYIYKQFRICFRLVIISIEPLKKIKSHANMTADILIIVSMKKLKKII